MGRANSRPSHIIKISERNIFTDYLTKPVVVIGCGNILFGDDGFGPSVIEYLEKNCRLPESVCAINAGTSVRKILFNILISDEKPRKIIIVDAVDANMKPGEIFEITVEDLPVNKIDDFSMHQLPTSNLLRELRDMAKIDVTIIAVQVEKIPESVEPGLSTVLTAVLPDMCDRIFKTVALS